MSPIKKRDLSPEAVEKDFLDALSRIRNDEPRNKVLKKKLLQGRLKINISNVALEAGRSRTLIASESGSAYVHIREVILGAMVEKKLIPKSSRDVIETLRAEKAALHIQMSILQTTVLEHFAARRKAEQQAMVERDVAARIRREYKELVKISSISPKL